MTGAGAKIPRNCVLFHTPLESPDLQEGLCKNGFNGNRPSLWVLQVITLPFHANKSLLKIQHKKNPSPLIVNSISSRMLLYELFSGAFFMDVALAQLEC